MVSNYRRGGIAITYWPLGVIEEGCIRERSGDVAYAVD